MSTKEENKKWQEFNERKEILTNGYEASRPLFSDIVNMDYSKKCLDNDIKDSTIILEFYETSGYNEEEIFNMKCENNRSRFMVKKKEKNLGIKILKCFPKLDRLVPGTPLKKLEDLKNFNMKTNEIIREYSIKRDRVCERLFDDISIYNCPNKEKISKYIEKSRKKFISNANKLEEDKNSIIEDDKIKIASAAKLIKDNPIEASIELIYRVTDVFEDDELKGNILNGLEAKLKELIDVSFENENDQEFKLSKIGKVLNDYIEEILENSEIENELYTEELVEKIIEVPNMMDSITQVANLVGLEEVEKNHKQESEIDTILIEEDEEDTEIEIKHEELSE